MKYQSLTPEKDSDIYKNYASIVCSVVWFCAETVNFELLKPDKKLSFKVFDQVRLFILSFLRKKSFDKLDNSNGLVSWLLQACTILELLSYRVSEKISKFLFASDFRHKKIKVEICSKLYQIILEN